MDNLSSMTSKNSSLPYRESIKEKARTLRNNPTPAETLFWNTLRQMPFYRSQTFCRQKPIGSYIVDFYCYRHRLVIEIDGDSHGETDTKIKDQKRSEFLQSKGLGVIRFTNRDVEKNIEGVMATLEEIISKRK